MSGDAVSGVIEVVSVPNVAGTRAGYARPGKKGLRVFLVGFMQAGG
ncbi:MAG: hypothetical protein QMD46_13005 [Methanomicrobiales archaeon]|nr:hypothetical protein [Methanomicrobiales archaeon]